MDGLSDDSLWLPVILLVDLADRLTHGGVVPVFFLCLIFSCYVFFGSWLDLLLASALFGLRMLASLTHGARDSAPLRPIRVLASLGLMIIPSWLILRLVRSTLVARDGAAWHGLGRPYLIPCRTTHRRQFPKQHSFSYSYLVVGVPVGYSGNANGMVSVDGAKRGGQRAWYHVDAADYLQRGHGELGLRGKLDGYLASQGADPADYPHAYLITAARFLGHHFNPVSFWYLYSPDRVLSAVVLEVNNTFGERRPYLVLRDFAEEARHIMADASPGPVGTAPSRVKGAWPKDFHVSPFNSRKGAYSLLANDPLGADMESFRGLNVTISLTSSKGHSKIIARLFSEGETADPSTMGPAQKLRFLLGWFWVGFATFPRIAKEAAVLFFQRKLHVWYRPEPLKESLGRHADSIERDLEAVFRRYLCFLVQQSSRPLSVKYTPSGVTDFADDTYTSRTAKSQPGAVEHVEMRILTPVFYSRFVHYAHDFEGIFSELTENGTVWVNKPHALPGIFLKKAPPPLESSTFIDFVCFKLIQRLRRRPETIPQEPTISGRPVKATTKRALDIRGFRISPMDAYVLGQEDKDLVASYRWAVLRLFLADRFLLGHTELFTIVGILGHASLAWVSAWLLDAVTSKMR
ncbi:hypothetical protein CDD83_7939 [Cordyceps sp. RAO-2017]|nr:hypothetical protein CDD83_7939 [Cordyceps sp. RAO-2017]